MTPEAMTLVRFAALLTGVYFLYRHDGPVGSMEPWRAGIVLTSWLFAFGD